MFFFFNDTATTEIYTLSLHDALPIFNNSNDGGPHILESHSPILNVLERYPIVGRRSEEHTSELQSHLNIVCRLLLEKKTMAVHSHNHNSSSNDLDGLVYMSFIQISDA